ncbi:hypothetical protein Scep_026178 [Stephania cephalantha]|uniref:Uncharacterized protein n=1 Tax=Stephania cephalantha TaxID=152367 RepID=A0AAP0HQ43_9MAGN
MSQSLSCDSQSKESVFPAQNATVHHFYAKLENSPTLYISFTVHMMDKVVKLIKEKEMLKESKSKSDELIKADKNLIHNCLCCGEITYMALRIAIYAGVVTVEGITYVLDVPASLFVEGINTVVEVEAAGVATEALDLGAECAILEAGGGAPSRASIVVEGDGDGVRFRGMGTRLRV